MKKRSTRERYMLKEQRDMHWPAALYTATIWMLLASFWQMYRPFPETESHGSAALRVLRDAAPAILLGILVGLFL